MKSHAENVTTVFERLQEYGFKVNKSKCELFKEKLEILGFVIDKDGLHKTKSKIKAILEASKPTDSKQLQSLISLVTYYARFLPYRATKLKALYDCANEKEFNWTEECDAAFDWVKQEIVSPRVLAHYDPTKPLTLACDASAYGLSAILSHEYEDGTERPIEFASKNIHTEKKAK